ncbi:MAG: 3-hydroxyacyl-CoA dehydrogenase NAD-binding domain-containing protein [Gammaproteobacteria bacterium]|nr:3-hydroxyacyl-CoA dehydrogenase NAD-binding domain-containing protein [Gammaproteobacteria bacterium]
MTDSGQKSLNHWRSETDASGLLWLCLDKADSSVNTLSKDVLLEFDGVIATLEKQPPRGLVIHSAKTSGFVMGADINEFITIETADQGYELIRLGQQLFDRLEALRCPTVAVLNGFALGGGLELAMACTYRIALENPKPVIGLPEVQLGLHPGFGGTVRSVRIAGVRAAMQVMLTGKPIRVDKARAQGFVDRIVSPDNWKQAAREILASGQPKQSAPFLDKLLNLAICRPLVSRTLIRQVAARARKEHYPSPYAMIALWKKYGASQDSFAAEARSFAELMVGSTSRNLVRVFFLQNRLKSQGGKPETPIEHVHVVGAGVMGGDIAAWCALRGLQVTLQDREQQYIDPAMQRAAKLFSKRIRDANDRAAASDRIVPDVAGEGAARADLVIEAIFENTDAKQALYKDLQRRMKPGAILATNTSSIRLEELRTVYEHPQRFIGLHFFNPVAQLPLVEVIRCEDTEQSTLDSAFAFVKAIGKFPLECRSSPGFVVNRILAPYMAEAMILAEAGIALTAIDDAAVGFGMPMGPIELIDTVGLDVAKHVSGVLSAAFDRDAPGILDSMIERGDLGRKSGQGFYRWEDGKAVKPDPADGDKVADLADRLILPLVNEAVAVLAEGVVKDADLLDAGVIFGTGFAPFRGGPLQYARSRGADEIVATLARLAEEHDASGGHRFLPHPGWDELRGAATT